MPGYAIVNLLEIDDAVEGRVAGLEGRFSRKYLDSRDLGVSHWRYAPRHAQPGGAQPPRAGGGLRRRRRLGPRAPR